MNIFKKKKEAIILENNQAVAVLSSEKERNGKLIKNLQVNQKSIATLRQGATLLGKGFALSTIAGMIFMNPILSIGSLSALTLSYGAYRYYQSDYERTQEELKARQKWDQCLMTKLKETDPENPSREAALSKEERIEYLFDLYTTNMLDDNLSQDEVTSIHQIIDQTSLSTKVKERMKKLVYRSRKVPEKSY